MVIRSDQHVMEVAGSDKEAIFRMVCVGDKTNQRKASCAGDGINHLNSPVRFIYHSQLQGQPDGTITEDWTADFYDGQRVGKSVFKMAADAGR